jgi:hypothetical protein
MAEVTVEQTQAEKDAIASTQKQDELKPVPYERFAEINKAKKELEVKLKAIEDKVIADNKEREDAKLKDEGDYKTLIQKVEADRLAEKNKLNGMIKNTYLNALSSEYGLLKPEYIDLFKADIQAEDLEIKNAKDVEKAFTKFKDENPTLFKEQKKVPRTDNGPVKKVNNQKEPGDITQSERLAIGLQEFRQRPKK